MEKVILASGNTHKLKEISAILKDFELSLVSMKDAGLGDLEIIEDGKTFEANSLIKAQAVNQRLNMPTIADDSGLVVDYLDGAPGVYSARYSGENATAESNNDKLLKALENVPMEERSARFVSVITMLFNSGERIVVRGECEGYIGFERKGDNGFGYDPLFIVKDTEVTFAQLSADQKNEISHRALALIKLKEALNEKYGE